MTEREANKLLREMAEFLVEHYEACERAGLVKRRPGTAATATAGHLMCYSRGIDGRLHTRSIRSALFGGINSRRPPAPSSYRANR